MCEDADGMYTPFDDHMSGRLIHMLQCHSGFWSGNNARKLQDTDICNCMGGVCGCR